jgi:non-heme chloroperoxidase
MNFFKAKDNTQIFYRDIGEGSPVILIHGWPLNADMWEYQSLELLRKGFRVISYDRRGFGRSDQTVSGYDYNTFADDLNSLVEALKLKNFSLVGFSMGGGEIARYLSRHGAERVASAVLISAVTPYMLKDASNPDGVDASVFSEMTAAIEEDRPHFLTGFTKSFYGESFISRQVTQETKDWTFSMAMHASLKATIDCVSAFSQTDFRRDLPAFTMPTLIIHGESDQTVPIKVAGEASAKLLPNAQFLPYDEAPHGLFITQKRQLNNDLCRFLGANRAVVQPRDFSQSETQVRAQAPNQANMLLTS